MRGEARDVAHVAGVEQREVAGSFRKGMAANNTPAELAALDARIKEFSAIFRTLNEVVKGDVITLDYFPEEGTRIGVNGTKRGAWQALHSTASC